MNKEKYFSIIVMGKQSSEAEEGELNKLTGQPSGPTSKIRVQVGSVAIPNHSKVWAERELDPKTKQPTGKLKFLPWQTAGGELVQIRYLEGVQTLDRLYQINVLKIVHSEEEANETAYINLDIGVNDFDLEVADPMFIDFIQHHTYCAENKSRKPNSKEIHFSIYDPAKMNVNKVEEMRKKQRAANLIINAEHDSAKINVLANLFELDVQLQDEVIFNELLGILEDDYKRVLEVVTFHEAKFRYALNKLKDDGVIIEHENDLITVIDEQREFLAKGIDSKDKIQYLVNSITEPESFEVYHRVGEIQNQLLALLQ